MIRISLFRQSTIWLPTLWGWLSLLAIGLTMGVAGLRNLYPALAPNDPTGARILVVEGWLAPKELEQAVQIIRKDGYKQVVTTGGPIRGWPELSAQTNYAKTAAEFLAQRGVPRNMIFVVPAPESAQDRTFLSAVVLRDAAPQLGLNVDAIDLFSSGAHARRSRLLFQMAFGPKVRVGVLAAKPAEYEPDAWWRTSSGIESLILQSIGWAWVKCCFWPGPRGSKLERWAVP